MKKRQRRTVTKVGRDQLATGIGWYSREQYCRLLEASEDRDEMNPTWEEWKKKAQELLGFLQRQRIPAREVHIEVEELIAWCAIKGRPVNGAARAEFISLKCQQTAQSR